MLTSSSTCRVLAFEAPPRPSWSDAGDCSLSRSILDCLQIGVVILLADGRVLFTNRHATRLLASQRLVMIDARNRLGFPDPTAGRAFRRALAKFADRGTPPEGETFVVQRSPLQPLVISMNTLPSDSGSVEPRVLVTLTDLACSPSGEKIRHLTRCFGLTPAEQRLTQFLVSGGCLNAAAKAFGVSRHTVRNQLRSVFGKVGVQRQTDLTRFVLAGVALDVPA